MKKKNRSEERKKSQRKDRLTFPLRGVKFSCPGQRFSASKIGNLGLGGGGGGVGGVGSDGAAVAVVVGMGKRRRRCWRVVALTRREAPSEI